MEKREIKGSENQLPQEGPLNKEPSVKYTWIPGILKAFLSRLARPNKRKREVKFKRTEVNKDGYVQQELSIKDEYTSND